MHGLGWLNIMTSIWKARVHGWMKNMKSSLLQIGRHWRTSRKQPRRQCSMWEEALSIYQRYKIQDNYKSELIMVVSKHKDPNIYTICLVCRGPVHTVNQWQFFDLKKSSLGDRGILILQIHPLKLTYPFSNEKKIKPDNKDTPHQHPYSTRSKTQTNTIFQASNVGEDSDAETGFRSLVSIIFVPWL